MSWDYYREGRRIAGLKILDRLCGGTRQADVRYAIKYDCCSAAAELTHADVARRVCAGSTMCGPCGRRRWAYYTPGTRVAALTVLERVSVTGKGKDGTIYRVRYDCCGAEKELSHYIIDKRVRISAKACHPCSAKGSGKVRSGELMDYQDFEPDGSKPKRHKRDDPHADYGVEFRPEWKVPSWIAKGEYVLWEDRMCA